MLADRKKGNSIKTLIDLFLFLPVATASHFYAQSIKNVVFRTEAPTAAALAPRLQLTRHMYYLLILLLRLIKIEDDF